MTFLFNVALKKRSKFSGNNLEKIGLAPREFASTILDIIGIIFYMPKVPGPKLLSPGHSIVVFSNSMPFCNKIKTFSQKGIYREYIGNM